jgi:hypothetical protein
MKSNSKSLRRLSGRRLSRLAIESLESRRCMAVTATFQAGILTVVGDAGPNVVELFQPADRVVQVAGDSETWTFSGVDEIVVNTGDGDDQATSSKPKEIVVVGSKIKFEMGAGNDSVRIDDGGTTDRPTLFNASLVAAVDLGTGADRLTVDVQHHDDVDLDVLTSDGGDGVAIGMLLPAVQKVRDAAARIQMQLVGGGNLVSVATSEAGDADLRVRVGASPTISDSANDRYTFNFRGTGNLQFPNSVVFGTELSEVDDTVSVDVMGLESPFIQLDTGGGDDTAHVTQTRQITIIQDLAPPPAILDLTMGDGNDRAIIDCEGYAFLQQSILAGAGNDAVAVRNRLFVGGLSLENRSDTLSAVDLDLDLGAGNDRLTLDTENYADVDSLVNLGDGNDSAAIRHRMFAIVDRTNMALNLYLGAGSDFVALDTHNYREVTTTFDTGPTGDGRDFVFASHSFRPSRSGTGFLRSLDSGRDLFVHLALGYDVQSTSSGTQITVVLRRLANPHLPG